MLREIYSCQPYLHQHTNSVVTQQQQQQHFGTMSRIPVVFLKAESSPVDDYRLHFTASSSPRTRFCPSFVPVLDHVFDPTNVQYIRQLFLTKEVYRRYSGIVFTSQRAVEAFAVEVLKHVANAGGSNGTDQCFFSSLSRLFNSISLARIRKDKNPHRAFSSRENRPAKRNCRARRICFLQFCFVRCWACHPCFSRRGYT